MATVFWDMEGVLLVDFHERGSTINTERYCETLKKVKKSDSKQASGKTDFQGFDFS